MEEGKSIDFVDNIVDTDCQTGDYNELVSACYSSHSLFLDQKWNMGVYIHNM